MEIKMSKTKVEILYDEIDHLAGEKFGLRLPHEQNGFMYEVVEPFFGSLIDNLDKCKKIEKENVIKEMSKETAEKAAGIISEHRKLISEYRNLYRLFDVCGYSCLVIAESEVDAKLKFMKDKTKDFSQVIRIDLIAQSNPLYKAIEKIII